jgi:hypothetical protein
MRRSESHAAGFDDVWGRCTPREVIRCDREVGNGGSGDGIRGFVGGSASDGGGVYHPI